MSGSGARNPLSEFDESDDVRPHQEPDPLLDILL
eukprot:CAMPEP_0196745060 /NCGR_PEP_ID=MMETSP1091-20130531/59989_1 /TAXON_ID=302021 /ORGANISM="Rhodomonas sp., Strain CCMP768" /LENGTH=33 /DNA_ID= /DNA_START= /DNA_END= /DNA_ORIENTATION=